MPIMNPRSTRTHKKKKNSCPGRSYILKLCLFSFFFFFFFFFGLNFLNSFFPLWGSSHRYIHNKPGVHQKSQNFFLTRLGLSLSGDAPFFF